MLEYLLQYFTQKINQLLSLFNEKFFTKYNKAPNFFGKTNPRQSRHAKST